MTARSLYANSSFSAVILDSLRERAESAVQLDRNRGQCIARESSVWVDYYIYALLHELNKTHVLSVRDRRRRSWAF